jgi:bifunctional ADP-heptose synthase (sugar kinase/adenylyltransferase)
MALRLCLYLLVLLISHCQSFQVSPSKWNQPRLRSNTKLRAEKSPQVICIGELLIDFVAQETNLALSDVASFTCAPGGAPANVAVGVSRLGEFSSAFVGKVGDDPFGVKLRNTLDKAQVDTSKLNEPDIFLRIA